MLQGHNALCIVQELVKLHTAPLDFVVPNI